MTPQRPYYDAQTRTHYIEMPRPAYEAIRSKEGPAAMVSTVLFADAVVGGEWVWVECEDDATLFDVRGIAAVLRVAEQPALPCQPPGSE